MNVYKVGSWFSPGSSFPRPSLFYESISMENLACNTSLGLRTGGCTGPHTAGIFIPDKACILIHWITMKTCRIPYENPSVRDSATSLVLTVTKPDVSHFISGQCPRPAPAISSGFKRKSTYWPSPLNPFSNSSLFGLSRRSSFVNASLMES